ncbi:heat shock protein Hsp33 [Haematococcus lacustris]
MMLRHRVAVTSKTSGGRWLPLAPLKTTSTRLGVFAVHAAAREDVLLRSLSDMGELSVLVIDGTRLVADAAARHKTAPTATAALGRALLGSLLLGSFRKDDEVTQVTFNGNGPIGSIMCIADAKGNVKGKVGNPDADPPLRPDNKLNVGAAVGSGVLAVVRSHPMEPRPYTGMVPLVSGEVAEDLASYLVDSEQTNSALGLGVSLNRDCSVRSAGGFLVQVLPFCSDETLEQLETNLSGLPSVTTLLNQGLTVQDITDRILQGLGCAPGSSSLTPQYGPCEEEALRKRMIAAVAYLGEKEVKDIAAEQGHVEVTCDFCKQTYQFKEEQILEYLHS